MSSSVRTGAAHSDVVNTNHQGLILAVGSSHTEGCCLLSSPPTQQGVIFTIRALCTHLCCGVPWLKGQRKVSESVFFEDDFFKASVFIAITKCLEYSEIPLRE